VHARKEEEEGTDKIHNELPCCRLQFNACHHAHWWPHEKNNVRKNQLNNEPKQGTLDVSLKI